MSHSPKTPAQYEAKGQQIGDESGVEAISNDYMVGFLDGFTAASATRDKLFSGPSLLVPDEAIGQVTPWPLPCSPALPQPELDSLASSAVDQNDVRISSLSYPHSFSRTIVGELPQPVMSPCNTSFSVGRYPSQNDSLPLKSCEKLPALDEVVDSFPNQPSLEPSNLQYVSLPALAGTQFVGPALKKPELFASRLGESPEALVYKPARNSDHPGNFFDTYALPTAETGVLIQSWAQPGATSALEYANLNEQAVVNKSSALDVLQHSPSSGALVDLCEQAEEEFAPCGRCASTPPHRLYKPCCRVEIIDIKLFRLDQLATLQHWMQSKEPGKGTLLLPNGVTDFEPPRKVQLTHDVCKTAFEVTISRYQPGPDDTTGYSWTDITGCKRKYELPPYYISDLAEAGRNLRQYIWKTRAEFTRALLVNSNPIILKTFKEAERYHGGSKSELVAGALMLWSATRMIERFWLITGDDMLGLPPMKQSIGPCRLNPYIGAVPVTPIMDTQLDEIAIKHVLIPLKSKLLRLLKEKVLEKKKENWYEIFIASFIILHNSEVILGHVMDYSRRFGISFAPRSNDETSLSHAYYHACKTVLAYFHFASGGAAPLLLDWHNPDLDTSVMSQKQIDFLLDLKGEVLSQKSQK
ncbi:hypothetical protein DL768_008692 [Monosporascus sp. mg162]|nr:hypothetical protein DL768_008692 [Monosporascus sp. mg162]